MADIRTFIAINLNSEIKNAISKTVEQASRIMPGIKWICDEDLHITLKFLGDVEENRIVEINDAISEALTNLPQFEISLAEIGAFPSSHRANIIWIGIDSGKDVLINLVGSIDNCLRKLGFMPENKLFSAHITIGRVKDPSKHRIIEEAFSSLEVNLPCSQMVESIDIMRSKLTSTGSIYSVIKKIILK